MEEIKWGSFLIFDYLHRQNYSHPLPGQLISLPCLETSSMKFNWLYMERPAPFVKSFLADNAYQTKKSKHSALKNFLFQSSETGFCWHAYLEDSREHSGLLYSEVEEVWNKRDSPQGWTSDQTEQSGEQGFGKSHDLWPNGHSGWEPKILCADGMVSDGRSLQHSTNQKLVMSYPRRQACDSGKPSSTE